MKLKVKPNKKNCDYKVHHKKDDTPQRIAVEAFALSDEKISGIGNVILNYLKEVQRIDKSNYYIIYSQRSIKHLNKSIKNWTYIDWRFIDIIYDKVEAIDDKLKSIKYNSNSIWMRIIIILMRLVKNFWICIFKFLLKCNEFWIPYSLLKNKVDIYIGSSTIFFPYFFISKLKKISFVYDIVWKLYPETMKLGTKITMKLFAMRNLKRSDLLISISDSTRRDVGSILNIDTKITTIPLAADKDIFYKADILSIDIVRKKYNISKRYILSVCTLEPRKNLISLLYAYSGMKNYDQYQLVLVGQIGWIRSNFFNLIEEFGIKNNVLIIGYVPKEDLAPLYTGAEIFALPSLYEGFGLPVLEAMQCGCPVVTSNSSSIPEVIGNAGIMIDAQNVDELKKALEKILSDNSKRIEMSIKGLERARKFSWEKSAKKLIELY